MVKNIKKEFEDFLPTKRIQLDENLSKVLGVKEIALPKAAIWNGRNRFFIIRIGKHLVPIYESSGLSRMNIYEWKTLRLGFVNYALKNFPLHGNVIKSIQKFNSKKRAINYNELDEGANGKKLFWIVKESLEGKDEKPLYGEKGVMLMETDLNKKLAEVIHANVKEWKELNQESFFRLWHSLGFTIFSPFEPKNINVERATVMDLVRKKIAPISQVLEHKQAQELAFKRSSPLKRIHIKSRDAFKKILSKLPTKLPKPRRYPK